MAVDWSIGRGTSVCRQSGQVLEPGTRIYSGLLETPEGFERADYALETWEAVEKDGLFSYWKTVVPDPDAPRRLVVDVEAFYTFFCHLADVEEPRKLLFRHFIALILVRRRALRLDDLERGPEGDVLVLYDRRRQETVTVHCPPASREDLEEVQQQLEQIFDCQIGLDDL